MGSITSAVTQYTVVRSHSRQKHHSWAAGKLRIVSRSRARLANGAGHQFRSTRRISDRPTAATRCACCELRLSLAHQGKVQLVFTSPPFPLNTKKSYGNLQGEDYIRWLAKFAPLLRRMVTDDGSIVVEIGNAWLPGEPVMSTHVLEALLRFLKKGDLHLCQEFIWYNPARLPSPIEWVNKERIRVKDAFTRIWWMSPTARPKADNRRVLREYSPSMKRLIATGKYNAGRRPSEHQIGKASFSVDKRRRYSRQRRRYRCAAGTRRHDYSETVRRVS